MNWLFPQVCPICGAATTDILCRSCAAFLPPENIRISMGVDMDARALYRYNPEIRDAVYRLKFRGQCGLAEGFGRLIARGTAGTPFDVVTYVPMDFAKRARRGYNQAELLARSCARALRCPCRKLLSKTRATRTQHELSAAARAENVAGAYRASSAAGLRVLLCDDIITTGATMRACAHALRDAGAVYVQTFCIAWSRGTL